MIYWIGGGFIFHFLNRKKNPWKYTADIFQIWDLILAATQLLPFILKLTSHWNLQQEKVYSVSASILWDIFRTWYGKHLLYVIWVLERQYIICLFGRKLRIKSGLFYAPPPSGSPRIPDAWLEIFYFLLIYIYIFLELKTHFLYCFVMHFSLIFDYCLLFIILYGFSRWCLGSLGWEWGEKSRGRGEVTFGSSVQEPRCTRMHCFFLRSCIIIQATLGVLRASRTTPQVSGI